MAKAKKLPAQGIVSEDWRTRHGKMVELQETLARRLVEELRLSNIFVYNDDVSVQLNTYDSIITNLDANIAINHEWMSDTLLGCIYCVFDVTQETSTEVAYKPIIKVTSVPDEAETTGWRIKIKRNTI